MIWHDDTIKLRPVVSGEPLRVGVWIESATGPAWVSEAIRRVRETPGLLLADVFADPPRLENLPLPVAYRWYKAWSGGDAVTTIDLTPKPADPPLIRAQKLDVLVWIGQQPRAGACEGLARCGVWSFGVGDYFWEMYRRDPVGTVFLYHHSKSFEEAHEIYRYDAATRETLHVSVNAEEPLSVAPVMLIRRLLDLRQHGVEWLERQVVSAQPVTLQQRRPYPGALHLAVFFAASLCRRLYLRWQRSCGEREWFVAYRRPAVLTSQRDSFSPEGFVSIPNPPGYSYADPFLLEWNQRMFLFVEQLADETGFGHLAVLELLPEGPSAPIDVLKEPFHLSYPCLIEHDGEIFMLPETSGNHTVELYRAARFPHIWKREKTLLNEVDFVDTTPFRQDDLWYFFTSTVDLTSGNWVETFLFYTDRLDGEWRYHPQNPICSDIRRARGAGNLFYRGGKLIRPAQDCSIRYGYAIVFNEVLKLSPEEYRERPIEVILPTWQRGMDGTHMLNAAADVEVIDGTRAPSLL